MAAGTLLFDLDGTLLDSAPDLASALNALLAELGAAPLPLASVIDFIGDGARRLVERGLAARSLECEVGAALARFLVLYESGLARETRPYEGVPALLSRLSAEGWRLALVTNKPQRLAERLLEIFALRSFLPVVVGGDRLGFKKPDPRHLFEALRLLERKESEFALLVGDGVNDLHAAAAARLPVAWASYGYGGKAALALAPAHRLSKIQELPGLLAGLARV